MAGEERYGFDRVFERVVAAACATRPKLVGQIAKAIDPNMIADDAARLTIQASVAVFKDTGRGPASAAILMQRLRRWMQDGKVTASMIADVVELLALAPMPLPNDEEIKAELLPVLQRKMNHRAIQVGMDDFANRRDMDRTVQIIRDASKLGTEDASLGLRASAEAFDEIRDLRYADRLPLGVPELDLLLGGGVKCGTATVAVAREGAGKSQFLVHVAAYACALGHSVGYITLELARGYIFARWASNLTLVPVQEIVEDAAAEQRARVALVKVFPLLGSFVVKEMPPGAATMLDVRGWVREWEDENERKMEVLVIDFADKLASHKREDRNTYDAQGTVWDDFRYFMHEEKKWGFSASQAQRSSGDGKKVRHVTTDNASDSKKKLGGADYGIAMTVLDDEITYQLGKHRMGANQGRTVGPLPHDFAHSRLVPGGIYERLRPAMEGEAAE